MNIICGKGGKGGDWFKLPICLEEGGASQNARGRSLKTART